MSGSTTEVFNTVSELEIFSLAVAGVSLLSVVILIIVVLHLKVSLNNLKKKVDMQARMDHHSFYNPAIQPDEELAKRGYSMYNGQEMRSPDTPVKEQQFGGDY